MSVSSCTVAGLEARAELADADAGGTTCSVCEVALLSDGREITLLDDRGWTSSASLVEISLYHVVRNIYNVVLPDDAEETGDEHEWQRFERCLGEAGVAVSRDELRKLPYDVVVRVPNGRARWYPEAQSR